MQSAATGPILLLQKAQIGPGSMSFGFSGACSASLHMACRDREALVCGSPLSGGAALLQALPALSPSLVPSRSRDVALPGGIASGSVATDRIENTIAAKAALLVLAPTDDVTAIAIADRMASSSDM